MVVLIVSLLLMLVSAAGMAFTLLTGGLTVDTLFFTLILFVLFLLFAANALYELRAWHKARRSGKPAGTPAEAVKPAVAAGSPAPPQTTAAKQSSELLYSHAPQRAARKPAPKCEAVEGLCPGNAILKEAVLSGAAVEAEAIPELPPWRRVACDSMSKLERPLHDAGLETFLVVGAVEGSAFALSRKGAVVRALGRVLARIDADGHNAAEIARVTSARFLGMYYATVVAHVRHVQAKSVMLGTAANPAAVVRHPSAAGGSREQVTHPRAA